MKVLVIAAASALLIAAHLPAQTAKVIQLTSADATEAKQIDDQQAALAAHRARFEAKIKQTYVHESGWESGFEYSTDFRFIVPLPPPKLSIGSGCAWISPVTGGILGSATPN